MTKRWNEAALITLRSAINRTDGRDGPLGRPFGAAASIRKSNRCGLEDLGMALTAQRPPAWIVCWRAHRPALPMLRYGLSRMRGLPGACGAWAGRAVRSARRAQRSRPTNVNQMHELRQVGAYVLPASQASARPATTAAEKRRGQATPPCSRLLGSVAVGDAQRPAVTGPARPRPRRLRWRWPSSSRRSSDCLPSAQESSP